MTLVEWRKQKNRVKAARAVILTSTFQEMLATLKATSPVYFQTRNLHYGGGVSPQDHSRMLGLVEGYALALDYLESMATPPPTPPSEIRPTFTNPEP